MLVGPASISAGARAQVRLIDPTGGGAAVGTALIDSGDQRALADPSLIAETKAQPIGTEQVVGFDGQPVQAGIYLLDWDLGAGGIARAVKTDAIDLSSLGASLLLGRNVLAQGVFTYAGSGSQYALSLGTQILPPVPGRKVALAGIGLGLAAIIAALL